MRSVALSALCLLCATAAQGQISFTKEGKLTPADVKNIKMTYTQCEAERIQKGTPRIDYPEFSKFMKDCLARGLKDPQLYTIMPEELHPNGQPYTNQLETAQRAQEICAPYVRTHETVPLKDCTDTELE